MAPRAPSEKPAFRQSDLQVGCQILAVLIGACSGGKFVLPISREAYDAHEQDVQIGNVSLT
jgi:hypothetical protein